MATPAEVRNFIAQVFDHLGVDSYDARLNKNAWGITKGSVGGLIGLFESEDDAEESVVYATFRIMKVPATKSLPFFRKLLEINGKLFGRAAFSVDDENIVWLQSGRLIMDLDVREVVDLVLYTSQVADFYDDQLLDEFGRENGLG
jgi:hypothetical protein